MKILTIRSRGVIAPYVMEGFSRAIQKCDYGHAVVDVTSGFDLRRLSEIEKLKPDMVLAYDFSGYIQTPDGYLLRQLGVPLIALHYDNPFYTIDDKLDAELRNYPENYYNFIWDRYYLDVYKSKGYKNGHPVLLAADPEWFHPQPVQTSNSFAFVGGIKLNPNIETNQPPIVRNFIDTAIDLKIKHSAVPLMKICQELIELPLYEAIKKAYNKDIGLLWRIHYLIQTYGTYIYRNDVLNRIDNVKLHLYGTDDWQKDNFICHGKVNYGSDLSRIYQQHAVNINLSSLQLETSVNNRVFDAYASNAFLLSDYKQDMESLFPDYWQHITFTNLDSLVEKGLYYLAHERERRALAYELHKQILGNHTYSRRLQQILQSINRNYS
jgi:spore maturation protein CgeB